jgi:hypothetical protein
MENEKENSIEKLKKRYSELQKKYSLPTFEEMNKNFSIEKADADSERLFREIIHLIAEKFQNYMRFIENLINPANASMFAFTFVKLIDNGKRNTLSEIYKKLSEIEIKLIKIDLNPEESVEAEFIKNSFKLWNEIKKDLYEIIDSAEKNFSAKQNSEENNRGYFG